MCKPGVGGGRTRFWGSAWLVVVLLLCSATPAMAQQGPTNLLVNGGFEWWDWNVRAWPFQDGIPEIQVCPGWRAFYVETPPPGVTAPESWKRPEFRDAKTAEFALRVRSGFLAQKYFTFGAQHIAGLYQQVSGIAPGTPLRFSAYMQTWGCMAGTEGWNVCPTGENSNNPAPMHTRVGIDPTGGTNPWAPSVIWSPEINAYDVWTLFQVDAIAKNSTVTVFTYSFADWFDNVFRIHNDVYIDDASLIALNEVLPTSTPVPVPTSTPGAALPTSTSAPTQLPAPTATPTALATATPSATATPLPPTATATAPLPTASPTPTPTPVPPTETPDPTSPPASPVPSPTLRPLSPTPSPPAAEPALPNVLLGGVGLVLVVLLVILGLLLAKGKE